MSIYNHVQHVVSVNEFRSIADLNGLIGSNDGDSVYVAGYYESINDVPWVKGGGHFVWDSTKLRTEHNGVTIISPTVQWDNTPDTLADYHAGTLEIEPSGAGCWVRQYEILNVHMAGAVGDGVTNDSLAFSAASTIISNDGGGEILFSGKHLIDDELIIADYVSLRGLIASPDEIKPATSADYDSKSSALVINSSATIKLKHGSSIGNCLIIRKGLDLPFADASAATAGVAAFAGTAITVNGQGVYCHHMLILGFARAIDSVGFERTKCEYIYGDCTNGIRLSTVTDIARVENCHFWPFTTTHQTWSTGTINSRTGIAYEFSNIGDWSKLTGCFSYGYANGFIIDSCDHVQLIGCGTDYNTTLASSSVGFSIQGSSKYAHLIGCQAAAQGTGLLVNSTTGDVAAKIIGCDFWSNDNQHIRVQDGRAIIMAGNTLLGGATGIMIDSSSDGAEISGNNFKSMTTAISGSGSGMASSLIGLNKYSGVTNLPIGFSSTDYVTETFTAFENSGSGYILSARHARGTESSPTVSLAGDQCVRVKGQLYTGSAFGDAGIIRIQSEGGAGAGSTPGRIVFSTAGSGSVTVTDRVILDASGHIMPLTDNAYSLGRSGARWSEVWAANGTIQTSDARDKTDIRDASLGLDFIRSLHPVSFKWISGGKMVVRQAYLDENGQEISDGQSIPDSAIPGEVITQDKPGHRTHWGLLAQEVKEVCDRFGVDFGGWILSNPDDSDSQQALRYDQFIAPLIKAVQEMSAEIDELKNKINSMGN